MFFSLLTLFTSLTIAGVAAWFSIVGLISIFPAATVPIFIMGAVLEIGKLVTASWVYRNWKNATFLLKTYLTFAVIILMIITSIGVFGFLSKAHLDQTAPTDNNLAKIERIEQQIKQEQKHVDSTDKIVLQLDRAVDTLTDYSKITGPNGAIATRKSQQEERQQLQATIAASQSRISELEDEKFALMTDVRKFEIEVGPVRYVAELFYGNEKTDLESAVRMVIILLVVVFDPLAVLLLIAANQSLMSHLLVKEFNTDEKQHIPVEMIPENDSVLDDSSINTCADDVQASPASDEDVVTLNTGVKREGWLGRGGR